MAAVNLKREFEAQLPEGMQLSFKNPEWRDDGCPAVSVYDGNDIKEVQIGSLCAVVCTVT